MKKMRKIFYSVLIVCALISAFAVVALASTDTQEPQSPKLSFEAANLAFDDSVYVLYAVSHEGIAPENVQLLFWTEAKDNHNSYVIGTESYAKDYVDSDETVNGKSCVIFRNNELRAKNMADYVYARAYANVDGVEYYSEVSKYSILQYAYNKLGYTGTESSNTALKNMLVSMLQYGADAQVYAEHNLKRLANEKYFKVSVDGGILEDGFTKGLYHAEETALLTAPEKEGFVFAGWKNTAGEIVSTDNPASLTDFTANDTYTATYEEEVSYSKGLLYNSNEDGTCSVIGIGNCIDTDIVIPSKSPDNDTVISIAETAFSNNSTITSVTIPDTVMRIEYSAFNNCTSLKSINFAEKGVLENIGSNAFYQCKALTSVELPQGIVSLSSGVFRGCSSLSYVSIPNSLKIIGKDSFRECENLSSVDFDTQSELESIEITAFYKCTNLTEIILPNSVVTLGSSAFSNCSSLKTVVLSNTLSTIGGNAFDMCSELSGIVIPDTVTSIGDSAFKACTSLTEIVVPCDIGNNAFQACKGLTNVIISDGVKIIGSSAFLYCENLQNVEIGSSVQYIGASVFKSCRALENIVVNEENGYFTIVDGVLYTKDLKTLIQYPPTKENSHFIIPESVTTIKSHAFYGCKSIESITIPSGVTSIAEYTFEYTNLVNVYFAEGNKLQWIGMNAFASCTNLSSITIPSTVISIGMCAFSYCINLKTINIPDSVVSIDQKAFSSCTSLENVIIPDSVKTLNANAFEKCTSLKTVYLSNKITKITPYLFKNCTALESVTIPNGVTHIGYSAFEGCTSLATVIIPSTVTEIGFSAFSNCTSLTSVIIPNSVSKIDYDAFKVSAALTIYCEAESIPSGWNTKWNSSNNPVVWNCKANDVADDGYIYIVEDGVRYALKDGSCVVARQPVNLTEAVILSEIKYNETTYTVTAFVDNAFSDVGITTVVIPDTITEISPYCFYHCSNLANIVFSNNLTTIGEYAFTGAGMEKVELPSSVTYVAEMAFYACSNLKYVKMSSKISRGIGIFYRCKNLAYIITYDIGSFNMYDFYESSNLKTVYYIGNEEDWSKVYKESALILRANVYYYTEEEPTTEGNFWYYDENGEIVIWN